MSNTETLKKNKDILENKITQLLVDFVDENGLCEIRINVDQYVPISIIYVKIDITI